jgi:hypothetical protein
MSFDAEQLYGLLPAVHRVRDAEAGGPLRELIALLADQVAVIEENLEQLYDNHFVETAAPWALPYLGDLLGIRGLPAGSLAVSARAEVGHTVAYRRRKGTATMLEQLARDVTGWPARAVEFFERLAATQHLNHLRPHCQSFASLRDTEALEWVGTAFEPLMRTVEVRRIGSGRGRWNIPNVGLSLWRLRAYAHTGSPLVPVAILREDEDDPLAGRRFRFHPLGLDAPLFSRPETETEVTHLAEPFNVPLPITLRRLAGPPPLFQAAETLYGIGRSIVIERYDNEAKAYRVVPAEQVIICDLSDAEDGAGPRVWNHERNFLDASHAREVALDPRLGRLVCGTPPDADRPPRATFHLGFSFDLGGGEYARAQSFDAMAEPVVLVPGSPISTETSPSSLTEGLLELNGKGGSIEMTTSGRFVERQNDRLDLEALGVTKVIRAADGVCPVVVFPPNEPASGDTDEDEEPTYWNVEVEAGGRVVINGLWLLGLWRVRGDLGTLSLRHCALLPSVTPDPQGHMRATPGNHWRIEASQIEVEIENSILPAIRVATDGVRLRLRNCIVDAGGEEAFAVSNLDGNGPAGIWRFENCTIIGQVAVEVMELASNCIFLSDSVHVERRQEGCVRFSWFPPDSRVPRRYRCLPDEKTGPGLRPVFTSLRFGHPAYGQLARGCPAEVRIGADDGAEMGAFHDLFQPQREAHLLARLSESLRLGLEAGVFHET